MNDHRVKQQHNCYKVLNHTISKWQLILLYCDYDLQYIKFQSAHQCIQITSFNFIIIPNDEVARFNTVVPISE